MTARDFQYPSIAAAALSQLPQGWILGASNAGAEPGPLLGDHLQPDQGLCPIADHLLFNSKLAPS